MSSNVPQYSLHVDGVPYLGELKYQQRINGSKELTTISSLSHEFKGRINIELVLHGCRIKSDDISMNASFQATQTFGWGSRNILPSEAIPFRTPHELLHIVLHHNSMTISQPTPSVSYVLAGDVCMIDVFGVFSPDSRDYREIISNSDIIIELIYPQLMIYFLKPLLFSEITYPPQLDRFRLRNITPSQRPTTCFFAPHTLFPDDKPYVVNAFTVFTQDELSPLPSSIMTVTSTTETFNGSHESEFIFVPAPSLIMNSILQATTIEFSLFIPSLLLHQLTIDEIDMRWHGPRTSSSIGSVFQPSIHPNTDYSEISGMVVHDPDKLLFYPFTIQGYLAIHVKFQHSSGPCTATPSILLQPSDHISTISSKVDGKPLLLLAYDRIEVISDEICNSVPVRQIDFSITKIHSSRRIIGITPTSMPNIQES